MKAREDPTFEKEKEKSCKPDNSRTITFGEIGRNIFVTSSEYSPNCEACGSLVGLGSGIATSGMTYLRLFKVFLSSQCLSCSGERSKCSLIGE